MPTLNSALERQVEHRLSEARVRFTSGRKAVVAALAAGGGPRSAAELHRAIGGHIPLSSLYRTLSVLERTGVAAPHHYARGITRYELAEWLRGHHHHLLCTECGGVDDIEIPRTLERELLVIVRRIGTQARFQPSDHALEIEGRCAKCL